jgi:hypothetical protein
LVRNLRPAGNSGRRREAAIKDSRSSCFCLPDRAAVAAAHRDTLDFFNIRIDADARTRGGRLAPRVQCLFANNLKSRLWRAAT